MVKWGKEGEVVEQRAEIRLRDGGVVDRVVVPCGSPGLCKDAVEKDEASLSGGPLHVFSKGFDS